MMLFDNKSQNSNISGPKHERKIAQSVENDNMDKSH